MKDRWFFSCGAGFHQIPLLQAAKGLGYRLAAADLNPAAPGFQNLVDRSFQSSITDTAGLLDAIEGDGELRSGTAGIYARSYGKAVEVAHFVGRRLGLISNPQRALSLFRDKTRYKKRLQAWNIPVPADLKTEGPFIIRPSKGHAKEGIHIAATRSGLSGIPNGSLIEPLIRGRESILLGFIIDRIFFPLIITDRFMHRDFTDRMHVFPSVLPPFTKYQMVEHCRRIVRRTGLENGPFLAEFVVDDRDQPFLIECAPEVGGEFLADDLIPAMTGIPYFEILVKIYTQSDLAGIQSYLRNHLEQPRDRAMVIRYLSPDSAPEKGTFSFSPSIFLDPGFYFARELPFQRGRSGRRNHSRPGVFALTGSLSDRNGLMERAESLARSMEKE